MTELYILHKKSDLFFCTEAAADRNGLPPQKLALSAKIKQISCKLVLAFLQVGAKRS